MQHKASQGEYIGGAASYGYALAADGVALVEDQEPHSLGAHRGDMFAPGKFRPEFTGPRSTDV